MEVVKLVGFNGLLADWDNSMFTHKYKLTIRNMECFCRDGIVLDHTIQDVMSRGLLSEIEIEVLPTEEPNYSTNPNEGNGRRTELRPGNRRQQ